MFGLSALSCLAYLGYFFGLSELHCLSYLDKDARLIRVKFFLLIRVLRVVGVTRILSMVRAAMVLVEVRVIGFIRFII